MLSKIHNPVLHASIFLVISLMSLVSVPLWAADIRVSPPNNPGGVLGPLVDDVIGRDGRCSLREALLSAELNNDSYLSLVNPGTLTPAGECVMGSATELDRVLIPAGNFMIDLAGNGPDEAYYGDLDVGYSATAGRLQIIGQGAQLTILTGNRSERIFEVGTNGDVVISGLIMSDGMAVVGGLIRNAGFLTLRNVEMESGNADVGGAIYNASGGQLLMEDCRIAESTATSGGGGIANDGSLTVNRSVFRSNRSLQGGGLINSDTAEITDSLLVDNEARGNGRLSADGGAIYNVSILGLNRSTLSGNQADGRGGGLFNELDAMIRVVTITDNAARDGGGIFNASLVGRATTSLMDTILAANRATMSGADCGNELGNPNGFTLTLSGSVVGAGNDCNTLDAGSNTLNVLEQDLGLALLANNGGPTRTHALLAGSPALDRGVDCGTQPGQSLDQRGYSRLSPCDAGAFEVACGDRILQNFSGEECDDGNIAVGDGCDAQCRLEIAQQPPAPAPIPIPPPAPAGPAPAGPAPVGPAPVGPVPPGLDPAPPANPQLPGRDQPDTDQPGADTDDDGTPVPDNDGGDTGGCRLSRTNAQRGYLVVLIMLLPLGIMGMVRVRRLD